MPPLPPLLPARVTPSCDRAIALGGPETLDRETVRSLAREMVDRSPAGAAAWLAALPASADPIDGIRTVAEEWVSRDPYTASEWVAALPPGTQRDAAINGLLSAVLDQPDADLERAAAWANSIADPVARTEALNLVHQAATAR
ncbi:hypothetical protein BH23VER1_BH23VER1_14630 [soil metagenome]